MGFWGTLLKVGGGIAGAPFTGGASLIPALASAGLDVAGGLASGMTKDRAGQNDAAQQAAMFKLQEARGAEDALMNRQALDLRQRQFGQESQTDAYKKAIMGALAKNLQDVSATRPAGIPTISFGGGARPSALGAEGRAAGDLLNKQAMQSLLSGQKFDQLPPIERLSAPQYKGAGFWENLLGGAGAVGKALSGAGAIQQQSTFQDKIQKMIEELLKGGGTPPYVPTRSKDSELG